MRTSILLASGLVGLSSLLAACVMTIGGTSCSWTAIHGSGVAATQTREVAPFQRVHVVGSAEVVVRVGAPQSLSVTCDDNLIEFVETEVRDGTLHIEMQPGSYSFYRSLEVEIGVPALERLAISGSGEAEITGLDGERLELSISGSGEVRAAGRVDRLVVAVSGSGEMDLFALEAREASVSISGSGDVALHAVESLQAQISGSGDVRYRGDPSTSAHVSGSGSVHRG